MSNRSVGLAFRQEVLAYLTAAGLPQARLRRQRLLLSEAFIEQEWGDVLGFPEWTIRCRSHAHADVSGAVNDALSDSEHAGTDFHATIQRRRTSFYSTEDAIVSMTLAQFARILRDGNPPQRSAP